MSATLRLPKAALIEKLEAARDESAAKHDERIKEWTDELEKRKTDKDDSEVQAEWYEQVAAGLRDGSVMLTPTGKLRGGPPKPGTRAAGAGGRRTGRHYDFHYYSEDDMVRQIEGFEAQKVEGLKPFNSAIELLNLSSDTEVEVDAANYQNLLNGNTRHGGSFW